MLLGGDFTRKKSSAKASRLNPQQVKWMIFYRLKNIYRQFEIIQFRSFRLNEPNKLLPSCLNDEVYKKVLKWPLIRVIKFRLLEKAENTEPTYSPFFET